MSKELAAQRETTRESLRQGCERFWFNKATQRSSEDSLFIPEWNIRTCERRDDTVFPLEYAFHLLGDVRGKTVVDLGCGGVNAVILASRGARVISIDISERNLERAGKRAIAGASGDGVELLYSDAADIPIAASSADAVFAAAILRHVDPVRTARQIRRVLKPGGVAVFQEPIAGSSRLAAVKNFSLAERALTLADVEAVCRAVGIAGRRREFWLTTRLVCRLGAATSSPTAKAAQRLDAIVLRRFPSLSGFASPLVWEARKES